MEPVHLFNLLSLQRGWLSARQSIVSQNIANANTPAYKTQDIGDFTKALDRSSLQMSATSPLHQLSNTRGADAVSPKEADAWEVSHSGNSVSLEAEMIKSGDIKGAFTMDTNIMKTFHAMWLMSLKG